MPAENRGYVYLETNTINQKRYIGSHCGSNPNYRGSGVALRHAQKKYGIENFTKQIIFYCLNYQEIEQQILIVINAANDPTFYNLTNAGTGGILGYTHTDEARATMSKAGKGRTVSDETRARTSAALLGIPKPKTTCPHCHKIGGGANNMNRWHFDNCKTKT